MLESGVSPSVLIIGLDSPFVRGSARNQYPLIMKVPLNTAEKTRYCSYWSHNARTFDQQGCYEWMASKLTPYAPKRVLDIGCGTGEGLKALLRIGVESVVCLEENFDCIKASEAALHEDGVKVSVVPRIGYVEQEDGTHDFMIEQDESISEQGTATLVHADPFLLQVDQPLKKFLETAPRFDAVTVWLIGTHDVRRSCRAIKNLPIKDARDYRLCLQNKIYELADEVLVPGGVLHLVDRGIVPDTEQLREMSFKMHMEQAEVTSLVPTEFDFILYSEPTLRGVGMTGLNTENPAIKDDGRRAMHSMISLKPSDGNVAD